MRSNTALTAVLLTLFLLGCSAPLKHVVFVTGDEEYRSEESMPMLAKILERDYPIRATILYALNKQTGEIDPETLDNLPGLEALETADLAVMFIRYRQLPDEQFRHLIDYCESEKPIVAFRTTNHGIKYRGRLDPRRVWTEGFGRRYFGQTFIGYVGGQTDAYPIDEQKSHPILRGVEPFHCRSWRYWAFRDDKPMQGEITPLVMGKAVMLEEAEDLPLQPIAWTKVDKHADGVEKRVFFTTMGHPEDMKKASMRRLGVNAILWALEMEDQIPEAGANPDPVGVFDPPPSKVGRHLRGRYPPP